MNRYNLSELKQTLDCLTLEDKTDNLSGNVVNQRQSFQRSVETTCLALLSVFLDGQSPGC